MKTIFDTHIGKIVTHRSTQTLIIIVSVVWLKGQLNFDCLIPQTGTKGVELCSATYAEYEVEY